MGRIRRWGKTLATLNGSPVGIAGGFSLGVALSLFPIPFVGMTLALALAPMLRCNLPATYLGTAVINPVTGPLFYFGELWVGMALLGKPLPAWQAMKELDAIGWWNCFTELFGPFVLGAGVCIVVSVAVCFPLLWLVVRWWQNTTKRDPASQDRARC